jgi:hypothetical protein
MVTSSSFPRITSDQILTTKARNHENTKNNYSIILSNFVLSYFRVFVVMVLGLSGFLKALVSQLSFIFLWISLLIVLIDLVTGISLGHTRVHSK